MTQAFKELEVEGMMLTPELAAAFSPYRTHHANRSLKEVLGYVLHPRFRERLSGVR